MIRVFGLVIMLVMGFSVLGQNKPGTEVRIKKATGAIQLDGILDEADWTSADVASGFYLNYPADTLRAGFGTEARFTFDEHHFYISYVCYDDEKPLIVQSMRRDFEWSLNDNVGIYMDPYNDYTNGFFFGISPYGVQREGTMSGSGVDDTGYNMNWDNKWFGEVKRYKDKWVAEISIPFKSFRYNSGANWNICIIRQDVKHNQVSSWIRTPIQNLPSSFPFAGKLIWETPPPQPGTNVSLIPYSIVSSYTDKENNVPREVTPNVGFDAKVGITPSMNLDMTINPDFSTVDVDKQIVNLSRYEFQYPERRQFFLENSDLFSAAGFTTYTQPFFTRRIGLIADTTGALTRVPIIYGARLSGKIGSKWRLGAMNLLTGKKESLGLPAQNYSVAVVQRQVFSRSTLGFIFVNKQNEINGDYDSTKFYNPSLLAEKNILGTTQTVLKKYNRIVGADFSLVTKNNRWGGKMYYHRSFESYRSGSDYSSGLYIYQNRRNLQLNFGGVAIGRNFNADVGFMPGQYLYQGYYSIFVMGDVPLYPKSDKVVMHGPGFEVGPTYLPDGTLMEIANTYRYSFKFRNTAMLMAKTIFNFQRLPSDFNPLYPFGDTTLLAGQTYRWREHSLDYSSDTRKVFTYKIKASGGEYYNGQRIGIGGTVSYRVQPYGNFSVTWDYNDIRLPGVYGSAKILLLSPRLDLTLSRKVFLTSFFQYNDRFNNVNFNSRFQWRFRPASDFFIVYAENYIPSTLGTKNRSLVLKFTYWFNL